MILLKAKSFHRFFALTFSVRRFAVLLNLIDGVSHFKKTLEAVILDIFHKVFQVRWISFQKVFLENRIFSQIIGRNSSFVWALVVADHLFNTLSLRSQYFLDILPDFIGNYFVIGLSELFCLYLIWSRNNIWPKNCVFDWFHLLLNSFFTAIFAWRDNLEYFFFDIF